nr:immunoglobulin light chain junction region [Macaca mulatta]
CQQEYSYPTLTF